MASESQRNESQRRSAAEGPAERPGGGTAGNGAGPGALPERVDIAIVGAGFSGLGMAIRLRQQGRHDFIVLERADQLGGTWRENTYPGCRCDVPSHLYSYSFAPNPDWTDTYSCQEEIWDYLRATSDRFAITPKIRFGCEVGESAWDEERGLWRIETSDGELLARVLVSAPGGLAEPALPELPGLERFQGASFHSAQWDHEHRLEGERVAVIGTGASAIQFAPAIQPRVGRMLVFQRTPPWIVPRRGRRLSALEHRLYRALPPLQRLVRGWTYLTRELPVPGFAFDHRLLRPLQRLVERYLASEVPDPELRERLHPDYELGCKRVLPSNEWYSTLQQPNVELVSEPIAELRERSIVTADGAEHEVDTVIFGTGFQVLETPAAQRVRGRDGRLLAEVWDGRPEAYLGTTITGFPNLFLMLGPNVGVGTTSVLIMAEAQIAHVLSCLEAMDSEGASVAEVRPGAQRRFNDWIRRRSRNSVWEAGGCVSWYQDDEGRNRAIWPSFTWRFRQRARAIRRADYSLRPAPEPPGAPAAAPAVEERAPEGSPSAVASA
jgi:cation diffusion facilitator CzcD-associated flavoprotein CzcO